MLRKLSFLVVLCALATGPALAAEGDAGSPNEERLSYNKGWGFRLGYMTADNIIREPIGEPFDTLAAAPRMDSSGFGGGYFYIDGKTWLRLEVRASVTPTRIEHVCPFVNVRSDDPAERSCVSKEQAVDTRIYQAEFLFVPHWKIGHTRLDIGVPFGAGWAIASAKSRLAPPEEVISRSGDVELKTSAGMTYSLGLRPILNIGRGKTIFVEVRALRLHRLVNLDARTAKTFEYSAGMSFALGHKKKKAEAPKETPAEAPKEKPPEEPKK